MALRFTDGQAAIKKNCRSNVYGVLLVVSFMTAVFGYASAETNFPPLDNPAIMVKAPAKVTLLAVALAGRRLVAVGEHGVIVHSDDNGRTWTQASVPVGALLTAVSFPTPTDGWAVGHFGVILHSVDAGSTWQLQLDGVQANQLTLAAAKQFVSQSPDSQVAQVALRRANIFVTAGPNKPLLSILATDSNNATVFGAYRLTLKTTDGGKTWMDWSLHVGDPFSHNLYDAATVGARIYIAAEGGRVFCSTDGGLNYTATTQPAEATMFGAIGLGGDAVLVFGVAGQAYRSIDAGKSWQTVPFNTGSNLIAATALKSGAILVISEDGTIYVSYDQGNSFKPLPQIQSMPLYGLVQAANGDVVLVGALGVLTLPAQEFTQNQ